MITRIRIVGIEPGTVDDYKEVARDWKDLLHKYGGRVLGFYFDGMNNTVTGIAEYESREHLSDIQRKCEEDKAYPDIMKRAEELMTSFEERILDKLEIDS
jgi:hypothetical protein